MSAPDRLRLGTRGSALALWQAKHIAQLLSQVHGVPPVEIITLRTTGDAITDVPLWQVEGKAFFTKELDDALLDRRIDFAVHSLKDLATSLPGGLVLAAVPSREDPRDALVTRAHSADIQGIAPGARIGTSSVRRRAFLRHHRPDLEPAELRGNVPTRVAQVENAQLDGVILAAAGLKRLGLEARISAYLDPALFPPAAAQGALGICAREDDTSVREWLESLNDAAARSETLAERAFLARLEAGCQVPAGVLARYSAGQLQVSAARCDPDGAAWVQGRLAGAFSDAKLLGASLADELLGRARPLA